MESGGGDSGVLTLVGLVGGLVVMERKIDGRVVRLEGGLGLRVVCWGVHAGDANWMIRPSGAQCGGEIA